MATGSYRPKAVIHIYRILVWTQRSYSIYSDSLPTKPTVDMSRIPQYRIALEVLAIT